MYLLLDPLLFPGSLKYTKICIMLASGFSGEYHSDTMESSQSTTI